MRHLPEEPPSSEVTPLELYTRRREFMKNAALYAATTAAVGAGLIAGTGRRRGAKSTSDTAPGAAQAPSSASSASSAEPYLDPARDPLTPYDSVTTYNNYYELGLSKSAPAELASSLHAHPWTVVVEGEIKQEMRLDIETLVRWFPPEERVYRMRCVEAWSMVIPWLGFSLGALIKRLEPTSRAKYVAFTTLLDPEQLPGQKSGVLDWPYVEGLRLDEAMHPLTLLATGLYGRALPGQNGAPLRLVVPWKYGFKGIKSIVHMRFTEKKPRTTWNLAAPREYGFFANVNPAVDHPRWSQATERRIGELKRRPTLPFNGYADAVASLYDGMDLRLAY